MCVCVCTCMRVHAHSLSCVKLCDPTDCSLPARPCPWNAPGKNIGVGWHFLLQGIFLTQGSNLCLLPCRRILHPLNRRESLCVCQWQQHATEKSSSKIFTVQCVWNVSCSVVCDSFWPHGLWSARLFCPWEFPGKNTGVGSHSFLQQIVLTQGSNPGLQHCRWILYSLSHQGSPTV